MIGATVAGITVDVTSTAEITKAVQAVARILNAPRSIIIIVQNFTDVRLLKVSDYQGYGEWAVNPSSQINPGQTNIYASVSSGGSDVPGIEGDALYNLEGENISFLIEWDNPFIGKNRCSASLVATGHNGRGLIGAPASVVGSFIALSSYGMKDTYAQMRFELYQASSSTFHE
jgi:hypothetical protein